MSDETTRVIGQPIRKDVPFIPNVGLPTTAPKSVPAPQPRFPK